MELYLRNGGSRVRRTCGGGIAEKGQEWPEVDSERSAEVGATGGMSKGAPRVRARVRVRIRILTM